jgi:hypothetical protein
MRVPSRLEVRDPVRHPVTNVLVGLRFHVLELFLLMRAEDVPDLSNLFMEQRAHLALDKTAPAQARLDLVAASQVVS